MSETMGTKSWAMELIENYRQGFSDAEVAASMNITLREFYRQLTDNPSFAKLVEFGRTLSLAYWEGLARKHVADKSFNSSLYGFYMKNKHGWTDKVETSNVNENTNVSMDELKAQIAGKIEQLVKQNNPELADAQRVLQPIIHKENDE